MCSRIIHSILPTLGSSTVMAGGSFDPASQVHSFTALSHPVSTTVLPMPAPPPADRTGTQSPFTFISPPSSNVHDSSFSFVRPATPSASKDDYTMINLAPPMANAVFDDDPAASNTLTSANITRLISLYNDAKFSNKNAQLFSIYQELERRCTGVNCGHLAKDYPAVYESKLNECTHKPLSELKQIYAQVQQQVHARTNNDATHINDLPKELLIESAALLTAIKQREL